MEKIIIIRESRTRAFENQVLQSEFQILEFYIFEIGQAESMLCFWSVHIKWNSSSLKASFRNSSSLVFSKWSVELESMKLEFHWESFFFFLDMQANQKCMCLLRS